MPRAIPYHMPWHMPWRMPWHMPGHAMAYDMASLIFILSSVLFLHLPSSEAACHGVLMRWHDGMQWHMPWHTPWHARAYAMARNAMAYVMAHEHGRPWHALYISRNEPSDTSLFWRICCVLILSTGANMCLHQFSENNICRHLLRQGQLRLKRTNSQHRSRLHSTYDFS